MVVGPNLPGDIRIPYQEDVERSFQAFVRFDRMGAFLLAACGEAKEAGFRVAFQAPPSAFQIAYRVSSPTTQPIVMLLK
jgi:hypothetical protein